MSTSGIKSLKKFVCVQFNATDESDVVPSSWLSESHDLCYWPDNFLKQSMEEIVQNEMLPKSTWKQYQCTVLCQSGTYEKCLNKAYAGSSLTSIEDEHDTILTLQSYPLQAWTPPALKVSRIDESMERTRKRPATCSCSENKELIKQLKTELQDGKEERAAILQGIKDLKDQLKLLKDHQKAHPQTTSFGFINLPERAETEAELDKNLKLIKNFESLGKNIQTENLRGTVRNFLRTFMSKSLASRFSWSGLGEKRLKTKIAFKDHFVYQVLLETLSATSFGKIPRSESTNAIKFVLHGVCDWDGGRSERRKSFPVAELHQEDDFTQ